MLLTITYTGEKAEELGYLLHKNPNRPQTVELNYGKAHVFYSEVSEKVCTAVLLLDIDPIDLARGRNGLFDYVNDKPYISSSFMSVAMARVFGTAMSGRSKERQELAETKLDLKIKIVMLPCRGNSDIIYKVFEPLGYKVTLEQFILDEKFPEWGESKYLNVNLETKALLKDVLNHIYVLIPIMDNEKHYWVAEDEVDKLLRHGEGWLSLHPQKEFIISRYFNKRRSLINKALKNFVEDESAQEEVEELETSVLENEIEKKLNLNQQRLNTVIATLKNAEAKKVIDIGCGEGNLLRLLLKDKFFEKITGVDVTYSVLERAKERLKFDRMPEMQQKKIELFQGSLIYKDKRFEGYDAAAIIEVIEHLDENRLIAFEKVLFKYAKPKIILITTPNIEYNVKYLNMPKDRLRHKDHRFEWTRKEFEVWAEGVAKKYGYNVSFVPIGDLDDELGAPTQMGVFVR